MRILIISIILLFSNNASAQSMAEKFKQQQTEVIKAPSSASLTEVLKLWETMQRECRWFHIGPKEIIKELRGSDFSASRFDLSLPSNARNDEDWVFSPQASLPIRGLPLVCLYQSAVWGATNSKNDWRGQPFMCDNIPSKIIKNFSRNISTPYVHGKLDNRSNIKLMLNDSFWFENDPNFVKLFELNFNDRSCFYEINGRVKECKLIEVSGSKISSNFFHSITKGINDSVKSQCSE